MDTRQRAIPTQISNNVQKPTTATVSSGLQLTTNNTNTSQRSTRFQTARQQSTHKTSYQHHPVQPEITPYQALYTSTSNDPQYAFTYCEDIHKAMLASEQRVLIKTDYMSSQQKITAKYREVLIDWLSSVRSKYTLKVDTFALCISLLDRFLEKREIDKEKLQLVGCTALWIASKYEEIYPPDLEDLIVIADNNFTREQFIMMERIILTILEFRITVPYAHQFSERFVQALPPTYDKTLINHLSVYIIESSYQHYQFVGHLQSQLAAAAVSLALFLTSQPSHFPEILSRASGYTYTDILPLFAALWQTIDLVQRLHAEKRLRQQQGIRPTKVFDSVLRLYSSPTLSHAPSYVTEYDPTLIPQPTTTAM